MIKAGQPRLLPFSAARGQIVRPEPCVACHLKTAIVQLDDPVLAQQPPETVQPVFA
jgi:hypothetical protein